jgi:hypothetical protein
LRFYGKTANFGVMPRQTATTAKPLPLAARKASIAKMVENAPAKVRAGIARIDVRDLTPREKEAAEKLARVRRGAGAA